MKFDIGRYVGVSSDPLQNLLFCMDGILACRKKHELHLENEHRLIGEMDYLEEIYRQLKELDLV